jgi:phosphoketolase
VADTYDQKELDLIDRYWQAANYLSVGQIYLLDNPLLKEPLRPQHVKPRLLGHWGTTPGLNFIYAHLNRASKDRIAAPGAAVDIQVIAMDEELTIARQVLAIVPA